MTIFQPHPASQLIPPATDDEIAALTANIATEGLQQAMVLCEGLMLDGNSRQQALLMLEEQGHAILPHYTTYTGGDPVGYVLAANLNRRMVTPAQRLCVAADYYELVKVGAVAKPATSDTQKLRDAVAEHIGLRRGSGRRLDAVLRIRRENRAIFDAMQSGGMSLGRAEVELGYRKPATVPPVPQDRAALVEWGHDVMVRAAVRYGKVSDDWEAMPDAIDAMMKELL